MPAYGSIPVPSLTRDYPCNNFLVWSKEAVIAGEYSQQVQIPTGFSAKGIRVEIDFSADPGAGEFYVMEGDNDSAGSGDYDQVPSGGDLPYANITAGPNGANTRLSADLIAFAGQFACIYCKTAPSNNGITVTARITRAA